ncbi:MAG TPA: FAD-dependent oxidoreductase [Dongiaceae bacterium]|jgi:dimethylamine/trimethylamine dehydrogenase|nr:FAD-dependent oxidoreductase [Dongiaceae bacterium]
MSSLYDVLFTPVKIGPVTAKNRFFQVPHCNGMGHQYPAAHAAMRGMKAEGGWAVVSTEECEIHPSGDVTPYVEARLWDDHDIPSLALMCEAVHKWDALAAVELCHNGPSASNFYSREPLIGPAHQPANNNYPFQARAMDREDIREFRRWHRQAARRARQAGFDIVYVYAGHDLSLPMHFLQRRRNDRRDEYGGSLENRVRLLREVLEDTRDEVGLQCGIALRFATDELMGEEGLLAESEGRDIVAMLAELPDLWDVNVSSWRNDSASSRFAKEGYQEPFIAFMKQVTTKPVVGVGRFTSPDTMVSQIRRGVLDMIGAARPSIADPFLPRKIAEGRQDEIRECIGCNICVSGDFTITPIRCTQNPTMGEEWRKGWHPEIIAPRGSESRVLIVGGGPAGLEAARALGQRGYEVHLAEARADLGGRVTREAQLPGLGEWARVRDHRVTMIEKMSNVTVYRSSPLTAADILEFAADHVVLATGARWRADGVGRMNARPITVTDNAAALFTPDDIMEGRLPTAGPVLVYDDDHYYLGGVIAEKLRDHGLDVTIVTPEVGVSSWTTHTLEFIPIQSRLLRRGVRIEANRNLIGIAGDQATVICVYTGTRYALPARAVVSVTARLPEDGLYEALRGQTGPKSVTRIGDCLAPGPIAYAVYSGHAFARGLDAPPGEDVPFRRPLTRAST